MGCFFRQPVYIYIYTQWPIKNETSLKVNISGLKKANLTKFYI